jgi:transposase
VIVQGTSVGLDVHALSVVAYAVDEVTGQVSRARLCPDHGEILGWLHQLRAPVRVAYEAGPTGFRLARRRRYLTGKAAADLRWFSRRGLR